MAQGSGSEDGGAEGGDAPVELSEEESLVLLSFDPSAPRAELSATLGMSEERLDATVRRLSTLGLIEVEDARDDFEMPTESDTASNPPLLDLGFDLGDITLDDDRPAREIGAAAGVDDRPVRARPARRPDERRPGDPAPRAPTLDEIAKSEPSAPSSIEPTTAKQATSKPESKQPPPIGDEPTADDDVKPAPSKPPADASPSDDLAPDAPESAAASEAPEASEEKTREYRKLYETELHPLSQDERALRAQSATGDLLMAFTFEPDPVVLHSLLENTALALEHVRLLAFHHRTGRGLEMIGGKPVFLRDGQVQRKLLRNPALTDTILRKIVQAKRLLEVYKVVLDREVPERTRGQSLQMLRQKWQTAQPEERVELLWSTEARVLSQLSGCTFDSKTTMIICSKQIVSIVMIQAFARFSGTPPGVLAHLLKQPLVKRQVHLRNMLLQHPNVPSDAKRKL